MIDTPEGIQAYHMLAQYHAAKLELKGLKHSSGRSVIAHIKRTYNIKSRSRQETVEKFAELLRQNGILSQKETS